MSGYSASVTVTELIEQADRAVAQAANQFAGRDLALDSSVNDLIATGLPNGGLLVAALCWMWFEVDDRAGAHLHRRNVLTALLAVTILAAVLWILKIALPFRVRPLSDPVLGLRIPIGADPASLYSSAFPSGHAAFFFSFCVPLWVRSRWLGAAAAVWTSLTICLPLLYRGDHWLSDIVAGAVIGVALMILLCRLIGATGLPDRILRFSETHPPVFYSVAWLFAFEIAGIFGDVQAYFVDLARLAKKLLT